MYSLAVLALALPAFAAPFQPDNAAIAARAEASDIKCNPPFPKAPYKHVMEAVGHMDFYFPIDADNKPITTSIGGKSSKRQDTIDDKLDFLGKQRIGENVYENSGRRATENPARYEVEGTQCMYISAVGQAGVWICNDSKEQNPVPFNTASDAATQAVNRCAPDEKARSAAMDKCAANPSATQDIMDCYSDELSFSAQVFMSGGWNLIVRKNDGIAPAMPAVPGRI